MSFISSECQQGFILVKRVGITSHVGLGMSEQSLRGKKSKLGKPCDVNNVKPSLLLYGSSDDNAAKEILTIVDRGYVAIKALIRAQSCV